MLRRTWQHDVTKRVGCMKQGTAEIKGHAWYDGFSWEACAARETRGPFPVQMASEEDTSAFDDYTGATGSKPSLCIGVETALLLAGAQLPKGKSLKAHEKARFEAEYSFF